MKSYLYSILSSLYLKQFLCPSEKSFPWFRITLESLHSSHTSMKGRSISIHNPCMYRVTYRVKYATEHEKKPRAGMKNNTGQQNWNLIELHEKWKLEWWTLCDMKNLLPVKKVYSNITMRCGGWEDDVGSGIKEKWCANVRYDRELTDINRWSAQEVRGWGGKWKTEYVFVCFQKIFFCGDILLAVIDLCFFGR